MTASSFSWFRNSACGLKLKLKFCLFYTGLRQRWTDQPCVWNSKVYHRPHRLQLFIHLSVQRFHRFIIETKRSSLPIQCIRRVVAPIICTTSSRTHCQSTLSVPFQRQLQLPFTSLPNKPSSPFYHQHYNIIPANSTWITVAIQTTSITSIICRLNCLRSFTAHHLHRCHHRRSSCNRGRNRRIDSTKCCGEQLQVFLRSLLTPRWFIIQHFRLLAEHRLLLPCHRQPAVVIFA